MTESNYKIDRVDRMYTRMKEDIGRHETLCFELALKFEQQHTILSAVTDSIETLKNYALVNDVHLEAYLPL